MTNGPTCGQGLAEHAALPQALGVLIASMAQVLELHRRALDPADPAARQEDEAYAAIAEEQRRIAIALGGNAARMTGHRDLPVGRHDEAAMGGREASEAFRTFVRHEEALVALLQRQVEQGRSMLRQMGAPEAP